jgi:hypothetical protein
VWDNVIGIEGGDSFRVDSFQAGEEDGHFRAVCVGNGEDCVISS